MSAALTRHTASPDRICMAAEISPSAMLLCDADWRIEWVNAAFTAQSGYTLEEVRGRNPGELFRCDDADPVAHAALIARVAAGQAFRGEIATIGRDGGRQQLELDLRPLQDDLGRPAGFVSVHLDIADARATARRLKLESTALREAGLIARVGGWELDCETGDLLLSPEALNVLGREGEQTSLTEVLQHYSSEEHDRIHGAIAQAATTGERQSIEAEALHSDGTPIRVHLIGEPEMRDGRCVAIRGVVQDITEQFNARQRLETAERFARGVLDGMYAGLCVLDETGAITAVNQAWLDFGREIGCPLYQEPIGRLYAELDVRTPPRAWRRVLNGLAEVLAGERMHFACDFPWDAPDGRRWFKANVSRMPGEGPVRAILLHQPITELKLSAVRLRQANLGLAKARDEAKAASAAKSAFLANMSHEIRTPLNGVVGVVDVLRHTELSVEQSRMVEVIRGSAADLERLLSDVLDLARVEAGRIELERQPFHLGEAVRGVGRLAGLRAQEKGLALEVVVAPEVDRTVSGDVLRLKQILTNLVSNAVKFTERGGVTLTAAAGEAADTVVLSVADTGVGFSPEQKARIFERFQQADGSISRRFGGSGLGLAISRQLAELMGGRLEADGVEGEGAVFRMVLPLPCVVANQETPVEAAAPGLTAGDRRLRILLADDHPTNRKVAELMLAPLAVELVQVEDGAQALDAWRAQGAFDLVLMDMQMPVMDGLSAICAIRAEEAATGRPRTPVCVLTANALPSHVEAARAAGADHHLAKPITAETLYAALEATLGEPRDAA